MKHTKKHPVSGQVTMDMTPMIDVTFLLVIFFMLVTELTRLEADQDVRLPHIDMSVLDKEPDPGRLILNVRKDGTITAFGRTITEPELKARLAVEAATDRPGPGEPSNRSVHIRADLRTEFRHIETVMFYCTQNKIKIWKISFGAAGQKTYDDEE